MDSTQVNIEHDTIEMMDDGNMSGVSDDEDAPSSPESAYDSHDLMNVSLSEDVQAQLAAAGPIGVAAAGECFVCFFFLLFHCRNKIKIMKRNHINSQKSNMELNILSVQKCIFN